METSGIFMGLFEVQGVSKLLKKLARTEANIWRTNLSDYSRYVGFSKRLKEYQRVKILSLDECLDMLLKFIQ